jgi:multiple antibiotic resistance protein
MRGAPEHLAGTIAMPFMIGPGTISAAVVTGLVFHFQELLQSLDYVDVNV